MPIAVARRPYPLAHIQGFEQGIEVSPLLDEMIRVWAAVGKSESPADRVGHDASARLRPRSGSSGLARDPGWEPRCDVRCIAKRNLCKNRRNGSELT